MRDMALSREQFEAADKWVREVLSFLSKNRVAKDSVSWGADIGGAYLYFRPTASGNDGMVYFSADELVGIAEASEPMRREAMIRLKLLLSGSVESGAG